MKQRYLTAFLAAFMVLFAASCADRDGNGNNTSSSVSSTTSPSQQSETSLSDSSSDISQKTETPEDNGEITASSITETIMNSVEFPVTAQNEDSELIKDTIGLDTEKLTDWEITQQLISVHLVEIIVIKPENDYYTQAKECLKSRKKALIEQYAFYPEQLESAEATVIGEYNGYLYLICHSESQKAEDALK